MSGFFSEFEAVFARKASRVLIEAGERNFTGADIAAEIARAAGALRAAGVRKGDRVLVQVEKSWQLVFLYLAALKDGAIYIPLNTAYRHKEFAYFLGDCEPALVVCDPVREAEYRPLVEAGRARLLTLAGDGSGSFLDAADAAKPCADLAALDAEDIAAIVYTSGTTGRSKGAMLSHGNLRHNAGALARVWQITADDVMLHALPLFHIHGLFIALNTCLTQGARTKLMPRFEPKSVIAHLPGTTVFMGVPTYYTRLLADPAFTKEAAKDVRLFVAGSAPLTVETFDAFRDRTGKTIVERYGMSECGIICSNTPDAPRRGWVGKPIADTLVRVADEDGTILPAGAIGTLEVKGPSVFRGYWRMPEKTASEFRPDGYFITGDLAEIDAQGTVRLIGRARDLVITGGLNVYPLEVEMTIDGFPGVSESAVIGLPHGDFGEAVAAVVCLEPEARGLDEAALLAFLKNELAGFKVPKAVFVEKTLPRNAMGKVEKALLRERYAKTFTG